MKRRQFIKKSGLAVGAAITTSSLLSCVDGELSSKQDGNNTSNLDGLPIVINTWNFGNANAKTAQLLENDNELLDAIIQGVAVEENNLLNTTVGIGGAPDREGNVTLDACVMNSKGDYGAVLAVENVKNVAALARVVMEKTPHVIIAGDGAQDLAKENNFPIENLLSDQSKTAYQEWLKTSNYQPKINIENHDTIGMLAMDKKGDIAGACTTSGLAYKMKGRVGDSAIIGSGLFIDNTVGGAVATGLGEEVLKTVGSFLIVELMRGGMKPQQACEEAINRITSSNSNNKSFQVAYIAIDKKGNTGSYCIHEGFQMVKYCNNKSELIPSKYHTKNHE